MNVEYKLVKASQIEDFHRPYWWIFPGDTDKNVLMWDVKVLRSHAHRLYRNLGPLRVAIQEKAMYCIGRHWNPVYKGQDKAFGTETQNWLANNWYPICDVAGPEFDFKTVLYCLSVNLDVFGEYFIYLTETEEGYPQIQRIPAHRIDQPRQPDAIDSKGVLTGKCFAGMFSGYKVDFGVIKNDQGRPLAYHVWGNTLEEDEIISANDLIRIREIDLGDETRSVPTISHGINQGRSILSLLENEQEFLELASRIALIENNDLAGLDPNDPQNALAMRPSPPTNVGEGGTNPSGVPADNNRQYFEEWQQTAQTRYYKSKSGGNVQAFQFQRPAQEWSNFMDKLLRFCVDPIWPFYLVDKEGDMGGANARGLLARTNRIVLDRQATIFPAALRIMQYAVAKGAKIGRIRKSDDWFNFGFTYPSRISADFGRDSKAEVMEINAGILDPAEAIETRGGGAYEDWILQRYENMAIDIKARQTVEAKYGIQLPPAAQQQAAAAGGGFGSSSGSGGGKDDEVDGDS